MAQNTGLQILNNILNSIYLMIEKGRIAQKDHIEAQIELRAKLRVNISI